MQIPPWHRQTVDRPRSRSKLRRLRAGARSEISDSTAPITSRKDFRHARCSRTKELSRMRRPQMTAEVKDLGRGSPRPHDSRKRRAVSPRATIPGTATLGENGTRTSSTKIPAMERKEKDFLVSKKEDIKDQEKERDTDNKENGRTKDLPGTIGHMEVPEVPGTAVPHLTIGHGSPRRPLGSRIRSPGLQKVE